MSDLFGGAGQLTGSGPAILLATLGAFCFAGAAVLQHRAVTATAPVRAGPGGPRRALSLSGLLAATRRPGWLLGLALAGGGTLLHGAALVLAPLSVVQPVGVLAVPCAVLLSAIRTGRRPGGGVLAAVAVCVAGVAAFVGIAAGTAVNSQPPGGATLIAGLAVAAVVLALAAVGLDHTGWIRCVSCATAGAVAFGLVSTLLRAVSQEVVFGARALLDLSVLATVAGIGVALLVGGWLVQQAFASGPPEVVIACLTVVDPIVAVLLGAVLLGEGAATPASTWLLLMAAAAAATAGVVALARHHPDAAERRAARHAATPPALAGRAASWSAARRPQHSTYRR
jgi:drug/metabolite transporter (DMT)-like permease